MLLVALALAATIGLGFRAVQDELAAGRHLEHIRAAARAGDVALAHAGEIRAALYASVATAQSHEFWNTRALALLDGLRTTVRDLSGAAAAVGQNMDPSAEDHLRRLVAVEARARNYVRDEQPRLAADIIFTEARDLIENLRSQIAGLRDAVSASGRAEQVLVRRRQALLAGGALVIWMIVAALLVPLASEREAVFAERSPIESLTLPLALADMLEATPRPAPEPTPSFEKPLAKPGAITARPPVDLPAAAAVCRELARVSDAQEISSLLERSARVLDASGLIVWLAEGEALYPAASWGYDPRLFSRIPSIPRDAPNLTASAFRSSSLRTSPSDGCSPAAFGAPLVGPGGAVGVLSGEVPGANEIPEGTSAVAVIFAAQLATLVGSMPPTTTTAEPRQAEA